MATTGKINGKDFLVYIGGVAITHSTSCSVSISGSTVPATTKDSAGWAESLAGERNWSVSSDQMLALDATMGVEEVFAIFADTVQRTVTAKFATSDATDRFFSGTARITGIEVSADNEAATTYSVSLEGTGALTLAAT